VDLGPGATITSIGTQVTMQFDHHTIEGLSVNVLDSPMAVDHHLFTSLCAVHHSLANKGRGLLSWCRNADTPVLIDTTYLHYQRKSMQPNCIHCLTGCVILGQYFLLDRYDRNGDAYHLSEAKVAAAGRSDRRMARELAYRGNDEEGPIVVVTLRPGAAVTVFGTQYYPLHFYTRQNGDSQRIDFAKLEQSVKDRGAHQHTQSATEHSGQWDHTAYRASYHPEPDAVASTVTATSTTI
jgi:hypothetical protein